MHAWQFMKMLGLQRANGLAQFVSMQNHYNLVYREEEREMLPLCRSEGLAVTPWSPLARGMLAGTRGRQTQRAASDQQSRWWYTRSEEHTSELQSLMRISYGVFCLKKKNTTHTTALIGYIVD